MFLLNVGFATRSPLATPDTETGNLSEDDLITVFTSAIFTTGKNFENNRNNVKKKPNEKM